MRGDAPRDRAARELAECRKRRPGVDLGGALASSTRDARARHARSHPDVSEDRPPSASVRRRAAPRSTCRALAFWYVHGVVVRQARSETVADACERELRRWIVRGKVRAGERLPPERVLAQRLGVNRTTLRSALTRLVASRLLRVRHGSGYVVEDLVRVAGLELVPELIRADGNLAPFAADLLRMRRALVGLALATPNVPDALSVEREVAQLREQANLGARCDELADAKHEVWAALFSASSTPVLSLSFNTVWFAMRSTPRLCSALYSEPAPLVASAAAVHHYVERPSAAAAETVLSTLVARDAAALARLGSTPSSALG